MGKSAANKSSETPLMKQYNSIKAKYPDAVLLFRVGDFYETFGEDAVRAHKVLGITLTRRANGSASEIELAGFPYHSLETYLPKLVRAGFRVAICEQMEDPKTTKTIVKRDVTELVTPGVAFSDNVLDHQSNNWLCALHHDGKSAYGIAFLDVSTGEFLSGEGDRTYVQKLLLNFQPSEVIYCKGSSIKKEFELEERFYTFALEPWIFEYEFNYDALIAQFQTAKLKGFGLEGMENAIISAGVILHYLKETRHEKPAHIRAISRIDREEYVWMDPFTIRNLELVQHAHDNQATLFSVLNQTLTPPGARLLRRRIVMPYRDKERIQQKLDAVEFLIQEVDLRDTLSELLPLIGDPERLSAKIATERISPRELVQMKRSLESIAKIKQLTSQIKNVGLHRLSDRINPCVAALQELERTIDPNAPALVSKGGIIKEGVHADLDALREISGAGKGYLLQMQQREIEKTGITSLKIAFNNVFGYYIEVTHAHKEKVPESWIRKQTLVNAERYITPELKEYEEKILGAEEKIQALEVQLFQQLVRAMQEYIPAFQLNAAQIGEIDCLLSFAKTAIDKDYSKPLVHDGLEIQITEGRHPIIESRLGEGENYIPNSIYLDDKKQQIIMITGPNMSGKSAILRQTALIVIMAQMGSFVPAEAAEIGWVDKIFTRVGANDNMAAGESTFMVEMNETAGILNNISERSLILLDEIGRGTSTYDGISIAWAIAEYLHEHPQYKPKTLFATHYHELNEMAQSFERIKNFHVSIQETANKIIFLRKLEAGGSEHSFGIHVAEMAGMPAIVLKRARLMLSELEKKRAHGESISVLPQGKEDGLQLSFFQLNDPVLENIREQLTYIDINTLTPVEALMKLNEIKKAAGLD